MKANTGKTKESYIFFAVSSVLVLLWMALIYTLSSQPSGVSNSQSDLIVSPLRQVLPSASHAVLTFIVRKGAHVFAYCVLGGLVYNAVQQGVICSRANLREHAGSTRVSRFGLAICATVICSLYAMTDEIHQLYVPGRSGEVRDILIDSIAAVIGVLVAFFVYWRIIRVDE